MSQAGPRRRRRDRNRPRTPSVLMLTLAILVVLALVCGSAWLALSLPEDEEAPAGVGDLLEDLVEDPGGDCLPPACARQAQQALEHREGLAEAREAMLHALAQTPDRPEAWLLLVELDSLVGGELDRARVLRAVERFHPDEPGLARARGVVALGEGRPVEAKAELAGVDDPRLRMDLDLALGRFDEARGLARSLLAEDPADGHACSVAAEAWWGQGLEAAAEGRIAACLEAGAPLSLAELSGRIAEGSGRHDQALSRYVAAGASEAEERLRERLAGAVEASGPAEDDAIAWRTRLLDARGPELDEALRELEAVDPQRFVLRRPGHPTGDWGPALEKTGDHPCVRHLAGLPVTEGPALWVSASAAERGLGSQALRLVDGEGGQARTARVAALLAQGKSVEAQAEALGGLDEDEPALRALLALAMAERGDPGPALRAVQVVLGEQPHLHALRRARYDLSRRLAQGP